MKTNRIGIEGMLFWAYHGVFEQERIQGGQFEVNVHIETDFSMAAFNDNITETVDYTNIYNIVKEEMKIPSNLLENVAYRISEKLQSTFPQIKCGTIKIAKINPPIVGKIANVWIEINF